MNNITNNLLNSNNMLTKINNQSKMEQYQEYISTNIKTLEDIKTIKNPKVRLRKAAQEMESLFVKMMLDSMKKNINKSGLFDGGQAEEIFDDMLYTEYSKKIAQRNSLGIASMIYNQYERIVDKS